MNIDYKILSKVLSERLNIMLKEVIHLYQSCGILYRRIQDNIHFIFDYYSRTREPVGIVLWDEEKGIN
jgi:hypothetical protein